MPSDPLPQARVRALQHVLDTYASEIAKTASVWRRFADSDLRYRPHERSATVEDNLRHEILSARRFFGGFLGLDEPAADGLFPSEVSVASLTERMVQLAQPRLFVLADKDEAWWLERVSFFDVQRERVWIVWRRMMHSAHHRTQLTVYLRLLNKPVPAIYGPSNDESWVGANPTTTVEAAKR